MELTPVRRPLGALAHAAGLALVLVGERVIATSGAARLVATATGLALVAGAAARGLAARGPVERRRFERALGLGSAVTLVGLLAALAATDDGARLLGLAARAAEVRSRVGSGLGVAALALVLAPTLAIAFTEVALWPMRRATHFELGRVAAAGVAGLTLGMAVTYVGLGTYALGELGGKVDFSYFRTARASASTRQIAASSGGEPVRIYAFFPPLDEVGREVGAYLDDLARGTAVAVEHHDRLLAPALAKEQKVTSDGVVVVTRGKLRETLSIGLDPTTARPKLRTLDVELQKLLLKVLRDPKIAYVTVGHGELPQTASAADGHSAASVRKVLEQLGWTAKDLGLQQGLGTDVPSDAAAVVVLGPQQPFLASEVSALERYVQHGGHLLLALDPEPRVDVAPLAAVAGLAWQPAILANEKVHLRRAFNDSDRTMIVTNRYSSHASVTTLGRNAATAPIVLAGAASFEKAKGGDPTLQIDFAVRTTPDTFADANGDFQLTDATEKRASWSVAAAVTRPAEGGDKAREARVFALADADALSDAALSNEPNLVLLLDVLRWLGGEESFAGAPTSTEDVRIEHTKQKDVVWFYATVVGVPALVLALGLWLSLGRSRARQVRS